MPELPGVAHVALTVGRRPRSAAWSEPLLGAEPLLDEDLRPFRPVVWSLGSTPAGRHDHPELVSPS